MILLDEIDKMGSSIEHGCPENVLLDILDSDRSKFVDNYLGFPLNLSNVIFVATANSLEPLSPDITGSSGHCRITSIYDKRQKANCERIHLTKTDQGVSNRAGRY